MSTFTTAVDNSTITVIVLAISLHHHNVMS